MSRASAVLEENKAAVDALNVFPVPDGDTGTNMCLTMRAAVAEMQKSASTGVGDLADAAAMGSLMGARGNSGVILSQIFRGIAKSLSGKHTASAPDIARALQEGVATAYKAVMRPVEGTILTVAREAAVAALTASKQGGGVTAVWEAALKRAEWILERTPDMLLVLKQAGVVDAGGKGLVYIFTGVVEALRGTRVDRAAGRVGVEAGPQPAVRLRATEAHITGKMGDIRFPYDTQFLVKGSDLNTDDIHKRLDPLGDSLLVVGGGGVVRVHIHTANPGRVLEACLDYGALSGVTIDNMREQHEAFVSGQGPTAEAGGDGHGPVGPAAGRAAAGVVAVSFGKGLTEIFKSLGAHEVINGGQTMNPSTEDVLNAIRRVPAEKVIMLPNNENIILSAKQAKKLSGTKVYVVPTKTIPQGIAALLAFQEDATMEANLRRMAKAVRQVKTGEVTYAVRNSKVGGVEINSGDVLGIWDENIAVTGSSPDEVLVELAERMVSPDDEILTVFYGDLVEQSQAEKLAGTLRERFPALEVEFQFGGQPLYYYIMSIE